MDPYAILTDLTDRLDWDLDETEKRIAKIALSDLSDWARHYGRDWPAASVPRMVRTVVLGAAVRYMRNPEGYTQSRAGDETVIWDDDTEVRSAGTAKFAASEIELLRELSGKARGTLQSAPLSAWNTVERQRPQGYVPTVTDAGTPGMLFPLFNNDVDPW